MGTETSMEDFFRTVSFRQNGPFVLPQLHHGGVCVCACVQVGEVRSHLERISGQAAEAERRHGAILSAPKRQTGESRTEHGWF